MSNYKIRVNSEAESKEAQELFFEFGYEKGAIADYYPSWISNFHEFTPQERKFTSEPADHWLRDCKEITLAELRDLVVLKRNNREDANVSDENCLYDLYLTELGGLYFYHCGKNKWILSNLNGDDSYYESLKPIEKKEMKEYLNKETHEFIRSHSELNDMWIDIPEGADEFKANGRFYKDGDFFFNTSLMVWACSTLKKDNYATLWKRATHPEELPFIDDEPLQSLNDQYAEIEKVRQTLNQRQEQYGSFEDVAMITEQMVDVMRKGYYENLAYNQKMALYMICSKMARIVNGNPNHKDSWHDIAGYATLIDNELVSEKDMPF